MRWIILILVAAALVVCGCKKEDNSVEVKRASLDEPLPVEQVKVDWPELEGRVGKDVELQGQVKAFIAERMSGEGDVSIEQAVKRAYARVSDPNNVGIASRDALALLIDLNVSPLLREELLHEHIAIVGRVATALTDKAKGGLKDKQAVPYLIHTLEKYEDIPGSEIMSTCVRLGEAMKAIADLDVEIGKRGQGLDEVISAGKEWAKKNGIKLLDE